MARQHGYFILIPAFIPVDKKSLQNQIATGTVIHEAAQKQSLEAIMSLPGVRYHAKRARDGSVKEMFSSWGSVEIEDAQPGTEEAHEEGPVLTEEEANSAEETPDLDATSDADPATTTGRRSRAKAA